MLAAGHRVAAALGRWPPSARARTAAALGARSHTSKFASSISRNIVIRVDCRAVSARADVKTTVRATCVSLESARRVGGGCGRLARCGAC